MARAVFEKLKACVNIRPQINDFKPQRDAINIIYKRLQRDREAADISHIMRELHSMVDESIQTEECVAEEPLSAEDSRPYDISKINFDRLRQEFSRSKRKRTAAQCLKSIIERRLKKLLEQKPLRTDFQLHYEKIVKE